MTREHASRVAIPALLFLLAASGCSTAHLDRARDRYYDRSYPEALSELEERSGDDNNRVLTLMERGMIHHTQGDYKQSNRDWIEANATIEQLDYLSISKGTASLLINDTTQAYTGAPFERSLLHAFTAMNYFALAQWREAAVEARLIADGLESLNDFPDDAYSHYVAGLAFELIRDHSNARIEYEKSNALLPHLSIGKGGILGADGADNDGARHTQADPELIVLVGLGRAPTIDGIPHQNHKWGQRPYIEISHRGELLGRSYSLSTTAALLSETQKRIAALKLTKTVTRIALKESISHAVREENAFLGEVLRLILYAFELPDSRGWETLPMWLQVARVPCPAALKEFTVTFRSANGTALGRRKVTRPLTAHDDKHVSFVREW